MADSSISENCLQSNVDDYLSTLDEYAEQDGDATFNGTPDGGVQYFMMEEECLSSIHNNDNGSSLDGDDSVVGSELRQEQAGDGESVNNYGRRRNSVYSDNNNSNCNEREFTGSAAGMVDRNTDGVAHRRGSTTTIQARPRAARVRNLASLRESAITGQNDESSLRLAAQSVLSGSISISEVATTVSSRHGSGVLIDKNRQWQSLNHCDSSTVFGTTPLNNTGRGSIMSTSDNYGYASGTNSRHNDSYEAPNDEPDEQSTTVTNDIFVSAASDRLRSLSSAIETHVESYSRPSSVVNGERAFDLREQPDRLDRDLTNVKTLMSQYGKSTSKVATEVSGLLNKLNQLNDKMSERIMADKRNADDIIARSRRIKSSKTSAEERASQLKALTGDTEAVIETAELNARTAESVSNTMQLVSSLMTDLDEVRRIAVNAQAEAEFAQEQAEAERIAEEARVRAQEQAKRAAEEAARIRLEDERRRAYERERLAAELARSASASRPGEVSANEIAKNPKYWPHIVLEKTQNFFDSGVAAIVRAFPNDLTREDINVEVIDQASSNLQLRDGEELLGNLVHLSYTGDHIMDRLSSPLSILLPHCGTRIPAYREAIVKYLGKHGRWRELSTSEIALEEYKELRLVECRLKPLGLFAVISRIRHDNQNMVPAGCSLTSVVDPRVVIDVPPNTVRIQTKLTLKLQPVESVTLVEFKQQLAPEEANWLISTSYFVFLSMLNHNLKQPLTLHLPQPISMVNRQKQSHSASSKRPVGQDPPPPPPEPTSKKGAKDAKKAVNLQDAIDAAIAAEKAAEKAALTPEGPVEEDYMNKPLVGIMGKEKEEEIIMVAYDPDQGPVIVQNPEMVERKKDILSLTFKNIYQKFILLRIVKTNDEHPSNVSKIVTKLEDFINKRAVMFLLRQKPRSPSECVFCIASSHKMDRINRQLNEEGFTVNATASLTNSATHHEYIVTEGQPIEVALVGNLGVKGDVLPTQMCFNSNFKNQVLFDVFPVDKFAQKSFETFHGFIDIFTYQFVEHRVQDSENHRIRVEKVWEQVKIAEVVVKIPKGREDPSLVSIEPREEIAIKSEDIIDEKLLRQIAEEVSMDWRQLAKHLGIKKSRVNAIFEVYEGSGPETCCFEALLTWYKQTAKCANKAEALTRALSVIGRPDLSENVNDLYNDYKREKSDQTAAEKMRIAFIRISQDEQVLRSWQHLARALQVSDRAGESIKRLNLSTREKCMHMLNDWRAQPGSTLMTLQLRLKHGGFVNASRLVRRIEAEGQ